MTKHMQSSFKYEQFCLEPFGRREAYIYKRELRILPRHDFIRN